MSLKKNIHICTTSFSLVLSTTPYLWFSIKPTFILSIPPRPSKGFIFQNWRNLYVYLQDFNDVHLDQSFHVKTNGFVFCSFIWNNVENWNTIKWIRHWKIWQSKLINFMIMPSGNFEIDILTIHQQQLSSQPSNQKFYLGTKNRIEV